MIQEEKQPRQCWRMGRIVEIIAGRDNNIRGAKVLVGKTGNVIERPVNKLCPVEFANEFQSKPTDDGIVKPRPRRNAAVLADIKRKFKE